jgi:hypothetical protein
MNKRDITLQTGWVLVIGESVFEFPTFQEAMANQTLLGGTLMTVEFYKEHYSKPI